VEGLESLNIFRRFLHDIVHCAPNAVLKMELPSLRWTCVCKKVSGCVIMC